MNILASLQSRIKNEIDAIVFESHPAELYDPIKYVLDLGGKRIRPLMVLMGNALFNGDHETAVPAALGIEIFHNFTLLHDDIMDQAPLRRSQPTVHEKWNANVAILSGDTMFVKAYQYMMKVPDKYLKEVLTLFNETAIKVCEGQQFDMNFEKRNNVSIAEYIKMIELKTAVLLAASLKTGAIIAGAHTEAASHIYHFGRNIGIAFQLQDDILDVYADESFGKQVGGDIVSNKKTFLLLKALELANRYQKEELENWIFAKTFNPAEKVEAVKQIFSFLNIRQLAEKEMDKYYELGLKHLEKIAEIDPGINLDVLSDLKGFAENLMSRKV